MDSIDILYNYAMQLVGCPYRWGGDNPMSGYDCSGLVIDLLRAAGLLAHNFRDTAAGLHRLYPAVAAPEFGALVFYGKPEISHIGFCLNEELMLEAGSGTAETITLAVAEAQNAFVRVRPIKSRSDLVGFTHPNYSWKE